MKAPRRAPEPGDLLAGDDHDFVVNLYLALLRRWPDEAGYRHFMGMVAGRPERRLDALRQMVSCTRFLWTPICRRGDRSDEIEHERDRSS